MSRADVDPGICGMKTIIEANKTGRFQVELQIQSECEKVTMLGSSMSVVDLRRAMKSHISSEVYQSASSQHLCISCPVPASILKVMEIELGLALPKDINIRFQTAD